MVAVILVGLSFKHLTQQKFKLHLLPVLQFPSAEQFQRTEKRALRAACHGARTLLLLRPCPRLARRRRSRRALGYRHRTALPGAGLLSGPPHPRGSRKDPRGAARQSRCSPNPSSSTARLGSARYLGGHGRHQLEEVVLHGLGPAPLAGQEQRLGRLGAAALPPHAQHGRARHGARGKGRSARGVRGRTGGARGGIRGARGGHTRCPGRANAASGKGTPACGAAGLGLWGGTSRSLSGPLRWFRAGLAENVPAVPHRSSFLRRGRCGPVPVPGRLWGLRERAAAGPMCSLTGCSSMRIYCSLGFFSALCYICRGYI